MKVFSNFLNLVFITFLNFFFLILETWVVHNFFKIWELISVQRKNLDWQISNILMYA